MGQINLPQIAFGKVFHARLFPKRNAFTYGIYYISIPISRLENLPIAYNRFSALSFHDKDHGNMDGSNLENWARELLAIYNLGDINGEITLICMPRVLGYVFNPVSFWLCYDSEDNIRAVLCEVHNTFGERHTYVCAHDDKRPITKDDILAGDKHFHVSPFLKREGHYTFQFDFARENFDVRIDFYDGSGTKQLVTALKADLKPMNSKMLRRAIWAYPLVTFKAITLIHWQALKLISKGIKFIPKPLQMNNKSSTTRNITKK